MATLTLKNPIYKYDYLIFIGRFQPFHLGHKRVIDTALSMAEKVLVFVGSASTPRNIHRNPFSYAERKQVIEEIFDTDRVKIKPINDHTYNDQEWITSVQRSVVEQVLEEFPGNSKHNTLHGLDSKKIGLIGCNKDESSYYLKLFPQWGSENVEYLTPLNSTDIRERYFTKGVDASWWTAPGMFTDSRPEYVPAPVFYFLKEFQNSEAYQTLVQEHNFMVRYQRQWANAPYPPFFMTVDAVVVQSGHILLVKRGAYPGKGMWALPGGFVNERETLDKAVLRELREETKLKVPTAVLQGSIRKKKIFDDPNRSSRGRTITQAYLIEFRPDTTLPKVKGGDDAVHAQWVPLIDVKENEMFEDHYHIIQNLIG